MSILRAGLLVVGIVLGSLIIAYGFPAAGSRSPGAHAITSPSASPSHHARPTPSSSGTPTAQGASSFTVKVIDSTGTALAATTSNCNITISGAPIVAMNFAAQLVARR